MDSPHKGSVSRLWVGCVLWCFIVSLACHFAPGEGSSHLFLPVNKDLPRGLILQQFSKTSIEFWEWVNSYIPLKPLKCNYSFMPNFRVWHTVQKFSYTIQTQSSASVAHDLYQWCGYCNSLQRWNYLDGLLCSWGYLILKRSNSSAWAMELGLLGVFFSIIKPLLWSGIVWNEVQGIWRNMNMVCT